MGVFDGLKQADLQQQCKDRDLSASGTNAEMIARLDEYEALSGDGPDTPPAADLPADLSDPPAPAPVDPPADPAATGSAPAAPPKVHIVLFPCPAGLSDGLHDSYRQLAFQQAVDAGYQPKAGLSSVHRSGWRDVNGVPNAVYEVILRKQQ